MMEIDGRDRAECQNWERNDKRAIFGKVKSQKDKIVNRTCLLQMLKEPKRGKEQGDLQWISVWEIFREREHFSLEMRAIRPSAVFGTKREAVLRGTGYAWTPDLRSFDKLHEVGVSPYLGFTLYLSVFQCFG